MDRHIADSSSNDQSSLADYGYTRQSSGRRGMKEWKKMQEKIARVLLGWMQSNIPVRGLHTLLYDDNVWADKHM